jgi:tetratricopeptide (TPR) repeat protein
MLEPGKKTFRNKAVAEKFWASVRPVTTLSSSHYKLGRYYQKQGRYGKAIEEFSKAIKNDRSFCKAYNGIAMSYDALGSCEMAHDIYEQALQCAPQDAYIYNNYACSRLLCGDYDKGVSLLTKAEQLSGDNNRIKNNLNFAHSIIDEISNLGSMITSEIKISQIGQLHSKSIENDGVKSTSVPIQEISEPSPDETSNVANHIEAVGIDSKEDVLIPTLHAQINQTPQTTNNHKEAVNDQSPVIVINNDIKIEAKIKILPVSETEKPIVKIGSTKTKLIIRSQNQRISDYPATDAIEISNDSVVGEMAGSSADYLPEHGFSDGRINNVERFNSRDTVGYKRLVNLAKQGNVSNYMVASYKITKDRSKRGIERNRFGYLRIH